ncbi:MAG: GT-D fold domain-containing glycosyltransferase [Endomicrobiaceae bacterium]|nr:GT-D fold domain-containing glycosyltransferase [Endomicrobiaceae bacterium]
MKNLLANIKFLWKHRIYLELLGYSVENMKYELADAMKNLQIPKILTTAEALNYLISHNISLTRFGDGELDLLNGNSICFQKANNKLSNRFKEILSSTDKNIAVGIPRIMYESKENISLQDQWYWRLQSPYYYKLMQTHLHKDITYFPAELTCAYTMYKEYDLENYFASFCTIWENKPITIIAGQRVTNNFRYNIFNNASSVDYLDAPSTNAFSVYNSLLADALRISKDRLILIILGPTATVLSYDLAKNGYRALDIGHLAKAYEWWKRSINTINKSRIGFFNPD